MPRYFFHVADGRQFQDERGTELPDIAAAQREAFDIFCQLAPAEGEALFRGGSFMLTATNETGLTLFTLSLAYDPAPVLRRLSP